MLVIFLMIALAVNGGMYLGILMYSAYKVSSLNSKLSFSPNIRTSMF